MYVFSWPLIGPKNIIQMKMAVIEITVTAMKNRTSLNFPPYFNGKPHQSSQSAYQAVTHDKVTRIPNLIVLKETCR